MFLAWREMKRARLRFALLAGAVGLLVFLILFVQALTGALIRQFIGAIEHQSADVLVYGADARKNLEGSRVPAEAVAEVAAIPGVAESGPLGEGTFSVRAGGELRDAVLFGARLGGPGTPTTVDGGREVRADFEAVASRGAEGDGFGIGDVVRVEPSGRDLQIVGLARDANYSVTTTLFTTYATYEAVRSDATEGRVEVIPSAVAVRVESGADAADVRDRINQRIDGVEALTRAEAVSDAPGVASVSESIGAVVFLCFFVVVVVSGLFFLILTVQKAQALTLLRAIGVRARSLVGALLTQVAIIVLVGVTIGGTLAWVTLNATGNSLGARVGGRDVVSTGAIVLVLGLIAALGAARRVLAIDPIRATVPGGLD